MNGNKIYSDSSHMSGLFWVEPGQYNTDWHSYNLDSLRVYSTVCSLFSDNS